VKGEDKREEDEDEEEEEEEEEEGEGEEEEEEEEEDLFCSRCLELRWWLRRAEDDTDWNDQKLASRRLLELFSLPVQREDQKEMSMHKSNKGGGRKRWWTDFLVKKR
jgi:hypothetical protein